MFHDVRPTKRLPCREILEPANSPPFRWRHSGGLLDSTMWSTSRSSALRPGSLMNRKLWVVGPESWKDLNFCHYPGRGSGVQVMLLRLFFAKRGEALSESWVSSNCDYDYGFIQCLSSFWYQQNSFFWVCRCTCTPNVHRMYRWNIRRKHLSGSRRTAAVYNEASHEDHEVLSMKIKMFWSLWKPMFEAGRCVRLGI